MKVLVKKRIKVNPEIYVDADQAADPDNRRSRTDYIFMLAGASISWRNKILSSVTLSTMKAEYICSKARNVLAKTIINRFTYYRL